MCLKFADLGFEASVGGGRSLPAVAQMSSTGTWNESMSFFAALPLRAGLRCPVGLMVPAQKPLPIQD